jgi:broad specificity phosphatase PhoE
MANTSPVTGVLDEGDVIIDFGKYSGMSVSEVSQKDPEFYEKLTQAKNEFAIRRGKDKTFRLYVNPLTEVDQ